MAHPHKKEAVEGHAKKLAGYGGKSKSFDDKGSWDGLKGLNNDEQAGLKIIDKEPTLSEETAPRIMRKRGGVVKGKTAVKRLDKAARKGKGRKGYATDGSVDKLPSPEEGMKAASRESGMTYEESPKEGGTTGAGEAAESSGRQEDKRGGRVRKASGGKMSHIEWEHSKKDLNQDRKLAKKHGMSLEKWEKSALDKKHDKQQSTEGLKRGGVPRTKGYTPENPVTKSARAGRASGGAANGKGKTTVNIIVGSGRGQDGMPMPPAPGAPMGRQPFQAPPMMPPAMPMAPAMSAAPAPMPPMGGGAPMGGAPGMGMPPGGMPLPRKRGGRIHDASDLTAGAGSGEGRLEKIELQEAKGYPPRGSRKGFK